VTRVESAAVRLASFYLAALITVPRQDVDKLRSIDVDRALGPELGAWFAERSTRTQTRVLRRAYDHAQLLARAIKNQEGRQALVAYAAPEYASQQLLLEEARALRDARR
jgi:hypothetical protein